MIAGVRGKVVGRQASSILLEVGGFVLQIGVPLIDASGSRRTRRFGLSAHLPPPAGRCHVALRFLQRG